MLSEEQYVIRSRGIGSSDVSAIVGENPYKNAHDVWLEKLGLRERQPETGATWLGHQMEPITALRYEMATGARLTMGPGSVTHPEQTWAIATTDREYEDGSRIVECKHVGSRVQWHWQMVEDGAPPYVVVQANWQMFVRGIDRCDIAVIFGGTAEFRIYELRRNDRLIDALVTVAGDFWRDRVLARRSPDVDGSESCREVLRRLYPTNRKPLEPAPPEAEAWFWKRTQASEQIKNATAERDLANNKLIEIIGDGDGIIGDFGVATFKADKNGRRSLRCVERKERAA